MGDDGVVRLSASRLSAYDAANDEWDLVGDHGLSETDHLFALSGGRFVVVNNGYVRYSADGGVTWAVRTRMATSGTWTYSMAGDILFASGSVIVNGETVYVVRRLDVATDDYSEDPIESQGSLTVFARPGSSTNLVGISPVSYGGSGNRRFGLYLSSNAGGSWDPVELEEALPVAPNGNPAFYRLTFGTDDRLHQYGSQMVGDVARVLHWQRPLGVDQEWSVADVAFEMETSDAGIAVSVPSGQAVSAVDVFAVVDEDGAPSKDVYWVNAQGDPEMVPLTSITEGAVEEVDPTAILDVAASPSRNWSVVLYRDDDRTKVAGRSSETEDWTVVDLPVQPEAGWNHVAIGDDGELVVHGSQLNNSWSHISSYSYRFDGRQWYGPIDLQANSLAFDDTQTDQLVRTDVGFFSLSSPDGTPPQVSIDGDSWTKFTEGLPDFDAVASRGSSLYALDGAVLQPIRLPGWDLDDTATFDFNPEDALFPARGGGSRVWVVGAGSSPKVASFDDSTGGVSNLDTTPTTIPFAPRAFNISSDGRLWAFGASIANNEVTVVRSWRALTANATWSSSEHMATKPVGVGDNFVRVYSPRSERTDALEPDVWVEVWKNNGTVGRMFHLGDATGPTGSGPDPGQWGSAPSNTGAGDPVNTATGNFFDRWVDLPSPAGVFGLDVTRAYNSLNPNVGSLGIGWESAYAQTAELQVDGSVWVSVDDGRRVAFPTDGAGGWLVPREFNGRLSVEGDGSYRVAHPDGEVWDFDLAGRLEAMTSLDGQTVTVSRDVAGRPESAVSSLGPSVEFIYTGNRLTSVTAIDDPTTVPPVTRSIYYGYDTTNPSHPDGLLNAFTDARVTTTTFGYDSAGRVETITDPTGVVEIDNTFDPFGRVIFQTTPSGSIAFAYNVDGQGATDVTLTSITPNETIRYMHDPQGRVTGMKDPISGSVPTNRTYDPVTGWMTSTTDRSSITNTTTWDDRGNPETVTVPQSGETIYDYDDLDRLKSETSPVSGTTTYWYQCDSGAPVTIPEDNEDGTTTSDCEERIPTLVINEFDDVVTTNVITDHLLVSSTDGDGVTLTYGYDAMRRLETVTDELSRETSFGYDAAGRQNLVITPEGRETATVFNSDGSVAWTVAPDDGMTSYTYDDAGRLLETEDPTGAVTRNTYHPSTGLLWKVEEPGDTLGTFRAPTIYHYDTLGQLTSVEDPTGVVTETDYGTFGRVSETRDTAGRPTTYTYDENGRVETVTAPDEGESTTARDPETDQVDVLNAPLARDTKYTYKPNGLVESVTTAFGTTEAATTTYVYDDLGRQVEMVDAMGRRTRTDFTPAGRVDKSFYTNGVDSSDDPVWVLAEDYVYDDAGQTEMIIDGEDGERTFTYWDDGMVKTETSPGGRTTQFGYDDAGRQDSVTDPAGVVRTTLWSERGEVLEQGWTGRGTIVNTYFPHGALKTSTDRLNNTTSYGYDAAGRMTARTTPMGTETWDFDDTTGELLTFTPVPVTGAPTGAVSYTYDDVTGRVETVTDGSGRVRTNAWNQAGELDAVTFTNGAETLSYDYSYDHQGRSTTIVGPEGTYTNSYNPAGQLTARETPGGRVTRWGYDDAGRLASRVNPDGTGVTFEDYDNLGRYGTIRPTVALADTFTQADGTGPDTQKWTNVGSPTVSGNKMVLSTAGGNSMLISKNRTHADRDVSFNYRFGDVTGNETALLLVVRNEATPTSSYVQVRVPSNQTTATVTAHSGSTTVSLGTFATPTPAVGAERRIRVRFVGTDLKVWVWDPAVGEQPATPSLDTTETTVTNGAVNRVVAQRVEGSNTVTVDDFRDVDPVNGESPLATYTYDPDGNVLVESKAPGAGTYAGTQTNTYHPTKGQLTSVAYSGFVAGAATRTLTYDTSGDIKTEVIPGNNTWTYSYDQAGQLTAKTPPAGWSATTYSYDRGRLASTKVGSASPTTFTYNERSQLTAITPPTGTATSIAYDGAGRRTSETTGSSVVTYQHDPAGRNLGTTTAVSGVTTASDARQLDPDGMVRQATTLAGGVTVDTTIDWDPTGGVPQMSNWQTSTGSRTLVHGPAGWAGTIQGPNHRAVVTDPHGSVLAVGFQNASYASHFDAWGKPADALTASGPKLGYRGELTIGGAVNLRHRDYQPTTGQFTTVDPLPDVAGTPTNGNPYHYTNNTPLNAIDPMGLCAERGGVAECAYVPSTTGHPGGPMYAFPRSSSVEPPVKPPALPWYPNADQGSYTWWKPLDRPEARTVQPLFKPKEGIFGTISGYQTLQELEVRRVLCIKSGCSQWTEVVTVDVDWVAISVSKPGSPDPTEPGPAIPARVGVCKIRASNRVFKKEFYDYHASRYPEVHSGPTKRWVKLRREVCDVYKDKARRGDLNFGFG